MTTFKLLNVIHVLLLVGQTLSLNCLTYNSLKSINSSAFPLLEQANQIFNIDINDENYMEFGYDDMTEFDKSQVDPEHKGRIIRVRRIVSGGNLRTRTIDSERVGSNTDFGLDTTMNGERYAFRFSKRIYALICLYLPKDDSKLVYTLEEKTLGSFKELLTTNSRFKEGFKHVANRAIIARGLVKIVQVLTDLGHKNCRMSPSFLDAVYANRVFDENGDLAMPPQVNDEEQLDPKDYPEKIVLVLTDFSEMVDLDSFCANVNSPYTPFDDAAKIQMTSSKTKLLGEHFSLGMTLLWAEFLMVSQYYAPPYPAELQLKAEKVMKSKKIAKRMAEVMPDYSMDMYDQISLTKLFENMTKYNSLVNASSPEKKDRGPVHVGLNDEVAKMHTLMFDIYRYHLELNYTENIKIRANSRPISYFLFEPIRKYVNMILRMIRVNNHDIRLMPDQFIKDIDKDVISDYWMVLEKIKESENNQERLMII